MAMFSRASIRRRMGLLLTVFILATTGVAVNAQLPNPVLAGYFHNWNDQNAPYIPLNQVDSRYNTVIIAFALPEPGTTYKLVFSPDQTTPSVFLSQVQALQAQGKKVLISIGGATATVQILNQAQQDTFVTSPGAILQTYGFDGVDIDLEGSSLSITGGTIANPVDVPVVRLINGIKQVMQFYRQVFNKKMLLTMAPETAYVMGGMSAYGGIWGACLPVTEATPMHKTISSYSVR